jgi:decaprenylphospho-beta-D-ribofuranose 2-oxidase
MTSQPQGGKRRLLKSYGRLHSARPQVFRPASIDELRHLFAWADREDRKFTFHAGAHSFDSQALNEDVAFDLTRLDAIKRIDEQDRQITVEPGVRWGKIVEALLPHGLTPYVVVTTEKATAGGTLSGNCLSRSSPIYGKEGTFVERFQLLTPAGELLECSRESNPDVFHAVVGGFGYLGAVVEITYKVLHIGEKRQIESTVRKYQSAEELIRALMELTKSPDDWDAVYSTAFFSTKRIKGFVFRARYTDDTKLRRILIHRPKNILRIPIELATRFSAINTLAWNLIFRFFIKNAERYVDPIPGYAFLMDGHRRAKEFAEFFGFHVPTIQQTYVLPEANTLNFFTELADRLRSLELLPNLLDVLFVKSDDFVMSANNGLEGYAVSVAFDDLNKRRIETLSRELVAFSDRCHQMGGRVYLVKNVHATTQQLHRMYAHAMPPFLEMKRRLDPRGILRNEFFSRWPSLSAVLRSAMAFLAVQRLSLRGRLPDGRATPPGLAYTIYGNPHARQCSPVPSLTQSGVRRASRLVPSVRRSVVCGRT